MDIQNITNIDYSANSGASLTLNADNGRSQNITLTSNTTITMPASPASGKEREIVLNLIQDSTGNRTVTWSGVTWATTGGVAPAINAAANSYTRFVLIGTSAGWVGYAANQNLGITDGSSAASGYIGEVISSTVAIGSAVSMTTATAKTITSIVLTPGDWMVSGNVGFIAASGTIPTSLTASISATDNTQATSPNGGAYAQLQATLGTASTNILTLAPTRINITAQTTYYIVGTAAFSGGSNAVTAYASITARRFR